jgi:hypothetical protein
MSAIGAVLTRVDEARGDPQHRSDSTATSNDNADDAIESLVLKAALHRFDNMQPIDAEYMRIDGKVIVGLLLQQ